MVSEVKAHYPIIFVEVKLKMYILDLPRGRIKNRWGGGSVDLPPSMVGSCLSTPFKSRSGKKGKNKKGRKRTVREKGKLKHFDPPPPSI